MSETEPKYTELDRLKARVVAKRILEASAVPRTSNRLRELQLSFVDQSNETAILAHLVEQRFDAIDAQFRSMDARFRAAEYAVVEYVNPRAIDEKALCAELPTMLSIVTQLQDAMTHGDALACVPLYASLKASISKIRHGAREIGDQNRHFAAGLLHDALLFTPLAAFEPKVFDLIETFLRAVCKPGPVPRETLRSIRTSLLENGFNLNPTGPVRE